MGLLEELVASAPCKMVSPSSEGAKKKKKETKKISACILLVIF